MSSKDKSKKQSRSKSANKANAVKVENYPPGAALSRALSRVATAIAVATSGRTKDGDRAQVKPHQRKATPKQRRSKVAAELLKDSSTHVCPSCGGTVTVDRGHWMCSNRGCETNFDPMGGDDHA